MALVSIDSKLMGGQCSWCADFARGAIRQVLRSQFKAAKALIGCTRMVDFDAVSTPLPQGKTYMTLHAIERLRQEPKRRTLTVTRVEELTPRMRRLTFVSPDLADFYSPAPDDHIKLLLPDPSAPDGIAMRDYTPRAFDPEARTLVIDFALHEKGPASDFARRAAPGDQLVIAGPRGSAVVPDDFDHYLFIGDETALPAIARRLEGLRAGVPVRAVIVVEDEGEVQALATAAQLAATFVFRADGADDAALVEAALAGWEPPPGDGYAWIAAEAQVARRLRDGLLGRGHPRPWLKAAGYWVRGAAGASEKMES